MFTEIQKRDGRLVPFDADKITHAIAKAGAATGELDWSKAERLTSKVLSLALAMVKGVPTVERIQDIVEDVLLASSHTRTAKAYVLYREQHAKLRDLGKTKPSEDDLIRRYVEKLDWQVNENSNMSYSLQGLNNYLCSETTKAYWLNQIYPQEIREAHKSGDFHVHDLSLLSVYCVGWDLRDLLTVGFRGAVGKAEAKPAKHFRAALGQIVNFFYTLQGEASGAQAFSSFDTYLAPFVRYDNLGYTEVKQALQEFIFNLNVPTRVGFQTPFTNITMDLQVPSTLKDQVVILGGTEHQDWTYGDFQPEMNLINRAFLEVMCEGDAKGRVFTFPIPTYNITKEFDFEDPALVPLWKLTARYGVPYFANFMNSEMKPEDARSMCCRLRLDLRALDRRGGGLFGSNPLTGSVGVVTMNLPRLGHTSKTEAEFLAKLDRLMDLASESLEIKRKVLERLTDSDLYPYSKFYLRMVKERHGTYWFNHFSTIGLIGMNEACFNLLGCGIASEEGTLFAQRVLDHMRQRLTIYQEKHGHFYNLEATPAEGTSHRLALLDKQHHPGIICANEEFVQKGAKPFYTNSSQLPVNYSDDIFEVLDHQDSLQTRYTGGTVVHVFVGEQLDDPAAIKRFVRTVCSTYHLPYFTVSPTFSVCPEHGYRAGKVDNCPDCGATCEVYSRIVGYLRPITQWNDGKREEFKLRSTTRLISRQAEVPITSKEDACISEA